MAKPKYTVVLEVSGKVSVKKMEDVSFLKPKGTSMFKCQKIKEVLNVYS